MFHELSQGMRYNKLHEINTNVEESKKVQIILNQLIRKKTKIKNVKIYLKDDRYMGIDQALKLDVLNKKL